MKSWIHRLAEHYADSRDLYPDDDLLVVFDIDGTILDSRYELLHLLRRYDQAHGTRYFAHLTVAAVTVTDCRLGELADRCGAPADAADWCATRRWDRDVILASHRPYHGVLEVIRWFQIQPDTDVALVTGRPESVRLTTLESLNTLGREFKVRFRDDLLVMFDDQLHDDVPEAKADAVRQLTVEGFRVVAMIDNEPRNLQAVAGADPDGQVLLVHADTIFASSTRLRPRRALRSVAYEVGELVSQDSLPRHVQFVWHGVDSARALDLFLMTEVGWAEFGVDRHPISGDLVVRRSPAERDALDRAPDLRLYLEALRDCDRGVKLDVKSEEVIGDLLRMVDDLSFPDERLWFSAALSNVPLDAFTGLRDGRPGAVLQTPLDSLGPFADVAPANVRALVDVLIAAGIDRFSLGWGAPGLASLMARLDDWDCAVNIYDVPNLQAFLQAILLLPTSITSSFDFPFWRVPKLTSLASGVRSNGILRNAGDLLPAGLQESSTRNPKT